MNITKFIKGCTTVGELENMPNSYIHTIYKEYLLTQLDAAKKKASEEEAATEEMIEEDFPMDRITFLESISGIEYPEMIVEFFDQFLALKYLVEDYGQISVQEKSTNGISFVIKFTDVKYRDKALSNVQASSVVIYGKPISINLEIISETEIKFTLH